MLKRVKTMLGIDNDTQDELLREIISICTNRVCAYIREKQLPKALEYVVVELAVVRFNRIASEGAQSHNVEGESWTFQTDDLAPFERDIQAWIAAEKKTLGKVKFL